MNNRQTSFRNNEWIRQKTNLPFAQYSPDAASTYNMRPFHRPPEEFRKELPAEGNKSEAARFNSQFYERSAIQTSCAAGNFPSNQTAIYSSRITYPTYSPSHQIRPNFPNSQGLHDAQTLDSNVPASSQFSKIAFNLSSDRIHDTYVSIQKTGNHSDVLAQHATSKAPSANQIEMTPNLNNNFIRQLPPSISNMPELIRQPFQPNSNLSNFIRPPASGFIRPPLQQCYNNPETVRPAGSSNLNLMRQSAISGPGQPDFIRPPSLNSNYNTEESTLSNSRNSNFVIQPSLIGFSKPDFIRQPPPLGVINQPPPNLPPSYMSSGNFPGPLPIPPQLLTSVPPPFATLNQDTNLNIVYEPNISVPPPVLNQDLLEENKIKMFLKRFSQNEKSSTKFDITVSQFRSKLKDAFITVRELMELKTSLLSLLDANENEWNEKLKEVSHNKDKLTKECDLLSEPNVLNLIQEKLEYRKRKRDIKRRIRANKREEKIKKLKIQEELHQTTDKWLESIKEKNLKLKREAEMKKEADFILAEVRRKIHEAKRSIEKIKVFEKLRSARHANAVKKGLFLPEHDERFKIKISELKATLFKQLSDYESEEKALKVMLEAEQEGQLEEEALWRIKKLKTSQQRRQRNIVESLFGTEEEPTEEDPIFLFHQFQNSGNKSIENLVQIRNQWDLHLSKDGETIPSQWVVPVPPSSAVWEVAIES